MHSRGLKPYQSWSLLLMRWHPRQRTQGMCMGVYVWVCLYMCVCVCKPTCVVTRARSLPPVSLEGSKPGSRWDEAPGWTPSPTLASPTTRLLGPQTDNPPPTLLSLRAAGQNIGCPVKFELQINNKNFKVKICPRHSIGHGYTRKNCHPREMQI